MSHRRPVVFTVATLLGSLLCPLAWSAADRAPAEPAFALTLNGPDTVWRAADSGVPHEVLTHDCRPGGARDEDGVERITVAAAAGQSVLLECSTPAVAALDELHIRLWVKSAQPHLQLGARIALPRAVDAETREVATTIIKGTAYAKPGRWQELVLRDVPKLLAAQVRIMRTRPGATIDAREAYLDSVVLYVPGDPNGVTLDTDQLEVDGVVVTPPDERTTGAAESVDQRGDRDCAASQANQQVRQAAYDEELRAGLGGSSPVRLQGTMLMVEGAPFLPRGIEWNGEPLKFLAERGFNVVQLRANPTPEQVADARKHGLWFISVPPQPDTLAISKLGAAGDRVLAWLLDDAAIDADPNYAARWAEAVRERDVIYGRPVLIAPQANWNLTSRAADIVVAQNVRASVMQPSEFSQWLASRGPISRPGTPVWVRLNTQFGEAVESQASALTHVASSVPSIDPAQLESLVDAAALAAARGFIFGSRSSLAESNPIARTRATALELLNRRLQRLEPWLAGGKIAAQVTSANGASQANVIYVDRSRLLLPVAEPATQPPAIAPSTNEIAFLVPGVSESSQVYFVTPASMRSLSSERVAGGTRILVPSTRDGMVVITEDPTVVQSLRQHIARHSRRTLQLERELAVERAKVVFQTESRLSQLGYKPLLTASDASAVNAKLVQIDTLMNSGQLEVAQEEIADTQSGLLRMVAGHQSSAIQSTGFESNALRTTYDQLLNHVALIRSFDNLRGGDNLLLAGDFENLGEMTRCGWQHVVDASAGADTHAELSALQPYHGSFCLELKVAAPANPAPTPSGDPLVWIVSPAMPVDAGKLVEITGWVRVDQPPSAPGGGITILDTLGGPELSLVVRQTSGWQPFRMLRAAPKACELRLTFALSGVGAAKVDAVMVRLLQEPVARRLPSVADTPR